MGVLVLLSAVASLLFPDTLSHLKPRLINPLLGIIMFGMGLTLKPEDFRVVFSRPRDVLVGCLAQFTVMPLLAFALTRVFRLEEALAIGVILVGCCPGGTASNVITFLARGDLALSVGMTAMSTLLAPVLTPLLVWLLAGEMVDVDVAGMLLDRVRPCREADLAPDDGAGGRLPARLVLPCHLPYRAHRHRRQCP